MATQVIMPQLGEFVIEGTVTKWLKSPGEPVKEYEPLLEVNTDKVDTEIPSATDGVLLEILVPEGTTVHAGTVLALIGEPAEASRQAEATRQPHSQPEEPSDGAEQDNAGVNLGQRDHGGSQPPGKPGGLGFISPVVAKIAQEHQLDLHQVKGTGLGGRITKKDVLAYIERLELGIPQTDRLPAEKSPTIEVPQAPSAPTPQPTLPQPDPGPGVHQTPIPEKPAPAFPGQQEIVPLTPVRRAIAEHMVVSKHTSPHVTTVMEADLSRVSAHRQAHKDAYARDGANLTFTAYFIRAAIAALKAYPLVNSSWGEGGIVLHRPINLGMAISLGEEGLIVPVIKNADSLSLLGLARAVNDLATRARAHKLQPDEVKGGTFTITNHGTSGSLFATPIINQPQCAILGIGMIQKRVVVVEQPGIGDTIAIRPMVYVSLTFDHRILDGTSGDAFLGKVVAALESWADNEGV